MRKVNKLPDINDRPTRKELLAMMKELEEYPEEVMVVSPQKDDRRLSSEPAKTVKIA